MNYPISASGGKKIIFLSLFAALLLSGCSLKSTKPKQLNLEEAKTKVTSFINANLMQPGKTANIKEITEEGGLYKVTVELGAGQEVVSYLSKDGLKFFPQVMDVTEVEKQTQDKTGQKDRADASKKENAPKNDKPVVELFVMSHCPYGTQIEKGIIPVVETLGDKIDFSLKFVDYAMHGEKEIKEQTKQVCVASEQKDKLMPYLKCFLKAGDSDACVKEAGVSVAKLNSCVEATDKKFQLTAKLNDKSKWPSANFPPFDVFKEDNKKYGVQGSPTLVVNGQQVETGRDSSSLLGVICSSFTNQPDECKKQLSKSAPAAGFGEGVGSDSGGGCATN